MLIAENNTVYKSKIDQTGLFKIKKTTDHLDSLKINYNIWYHPPLPTIEEALKFWQEMPGTHCKNLFFRNHKGKKHYLVVFECHKKLNISSLENKLKEGKLTFASEKRLDRYLGVTPGSVSPLALINDTDNQVKLFIDKELLSSEELSFHPNDNRASLVLKTKDFLKFIESLNTQMEPINFTSSHL